MVSSAGQIGTPICPPIRVATGAAHQDQPHVLETNSVDNAPQHAKIVARRAFTD